MISWRPAILACIRQAAGFGDVAGLLQADLPGRVAHQRVGVAELQLALADRHAAPGEVDSSRMIGCS